MTTKQYDVDNSQLVMCNEFLLGDILSRVPVKPLRRFKCVCKQWQSLIHKDRSFIDLHFTRSKASSFAVGGISLLTTRPTRDYVFSSVELLENVQREVLVPGASYCTHVCGGVNGLIALVNRTTSCVCILNPSTGQSTPWIQPTFMQQHGQYVNRNWYYFGYDPATMEHKVVFFCMKRICDCRGVFLRYENICEVMTVDGRQHNNNNLLWRRIDDKFSLPSKMSPEEFTSSVYANGSIYWLRTSYKRRQVTEPLIVEFNVGSEKLRVVSLPNFIEEFCYPSVCKLIQIDGRLAVLALDTTTKKSLASMKMCVLYEKKFKDIISSTVTSTSSAAGSNVSNSGDFYWTEETFMMPHFDWTIPIQFNSIQGFPGTELLISRSEREAGSTFYFYDWRKKSLSKEIFFTAKRKTPSLEYFIYKESLLPVI